MGVPKPLFNSCNSSGFFAQNFSRCCEVPPTIPPSVTRRQRQMRFTQLCHLCWRSLHVYEQLFLSKALSSVQSLWRRWI